LSARKYIVSYLIVINQACEAIRCKNVGATFKVSQKGEQSAN